jgi:hypothetical protein
MRPSLRSRDAPLGGSEEAERRDRLAVGFVFFALFELFELFEAALRAGFPAERPPLARLPPRPDEVADFLLTANPHPPARRYRTNAS